MGSVLHGAAGAQLTLVIGAAMSLTFLLEALARSGAAYLRRMKQESLLFAFDSMSDRYLPM